MISESLICLSSRANQLFLVQNLLRSHPVGKLESLVDVREHFAMQAVDLHVHPSGQKKKQEEGKKKGKRFLWGLLVTYFQTRAEVQLSKRYSTSKV